MHIVHVIVNLFKANIQLLYTLNMTELISNYVRKFYWQFLRSRESNNPIFEIVLRFARFFYGAEERG